MNKEDIRKVEEWLKKFIKQNKLINNKKYKLKKNKKDIINILLLYGDDDIQKRLIIEESNIFINYNLCYLSEEELDKLYKQKDVNYNSFIYRFFNQLSFNDDLNLKSRIMIINENNIYNFHKYKDIIINIVNANNNINPIIILLNSSHSKLLNILKKKTYNILLTTLLTPDITLYITKKIKQENIIDKTNTKFIDLLIKLSNYNLNKINTLLYDLTKSYCKNKIITLQDLEDFKNDTIMNNNKETLIDTNYKLLTKFNGIKESYELFNHDKINNPLVMEEQYINKIIKYEKDYKDDKDKMKFLNNITLKISKCFVYGNLYDAYIYNYQKWDLLNIYGYLTCILPSYYLSLLKTIYPFNPNIYFPIDMNKSSIQKINTKQIDSIYENINLIDITYYIYLNDLIYYLITKSSNNTLNINRKKITIITKDLIKTYGLNMQLIEKILKINKLSDHELKLSKKMYNYLFPSDE